MVQTTGATARRPRRGGKSAEASGEMLLFGFECDVKNASLSQIFLTQPMLGVVTVVFGQIVRVIRLVLRVSWCESQNASLQALFVCVYDGECGISSCSVAPQAKTLDFRHRKSCLTECSSQSSQITSQSLSLISLGKASENQTPYRSQNPHFTNQPSSIDGMF